MMPIMDGFRFREEQEKDVRLAPIPIVLMTADAHIEAKRLKIGAQAFIRKPIDIDELSLILKKF
jgi:CheY-like chemotaxis protein